MPVDDRTRLNLHRKLEAVLGNEEADTLMAHLPPVTWNEVATKDDLRAEAVGLHGEIAELRGEMRAEFADVRGEMRAGFADVRGEMRAGFADVRGEMRAEFADVRGEMRAGFALVRGELAALGGDLRADVAGVRGEFHQAIVDQTRWLVGFICGWSAVVVTVAKLVL
ncbi:MAG TPA: hypothetical protein VMM60_00070 [Ilumatobacter sp.]|nr:hypothetical protein [Ilumatobacter sp.]